MKQLKIKITDVNGKDWGYKKIMSMSWDNQGNLYMIMVNFMESDIASNFAPFYDYNNTGEFTNNAGNLKGKIIYN